MTRQPVRQCDDQRQSQAARRPPDASAPDRHRRGFAALLIALLTAGVLAPGLAQAAPTTARAGHPGPCRDAAGVTVVVDFTSLGGRVVERCAPGSRPGDDTGIQALADAGFREGGTQEWGNAFVCRIQNRPSASRSLNLSGDRSYREQCVTTPPAQAHWSYWYAPNGGRWIYSQTGAASHVPIRGGFEGWTFTLGETSQSGAAPPDAEPNRDEPVVRTTADPPRAARQRALSEVARRTSAGRRGPTTSVRPAIVGIGVIGLLALGAGVTAWRRSH